MHNITPTKSKGKTPMELWNGKKPSVRHVKPFGCVAFYKVFDNKRHKLQPKSKKGVFVGYSRNRKAYRICDIEERQIHETSDVVFDETKNGYAQKELPKNTENYTQIEYIWSNPENQQTDEPTNQTVIQEQIEGTVSTEINDDLTTDDEDDGNQNISNRPVKNRRLPSRYEDYEVYAVSDATPETYEDAAVSQEKDKWKDAMDKEINSFEMHNLWEEVERPQNKKVVKSRWVYKIKKLDDEKLYKARLVAVGCGQRQGIDFEESFSPVMKWDSLRILLKIAAMKKSVVKFFDVKTAYLNGILNEELYMETPKGYELRSNKVFKINKSIYGLPQSGRCWYNKFNEILAQAGFKKIKSDPSVYTKRAEKEFIHIGIYVDDFVIISSSAEMINQVIGSVKKEIDVKETTESNIFLGVEIKKTEENITLSQRNYVKKILEKFKMTDFTPMKTHGIIGDTSLDNYDDSRPFSSKTYQEAIGSLMYLATGTRTDISYIVGKLSQYNRDPREIHWVAVKRILRYLRGTSDYCLRFNSTPGKLKACTDASWSTTADAKSCSGYFLKLGENVVGWRSSKQKLVALSTMESELIAACDCVCAVKWCVSLLEELRENHLIEVPTPVETDSQGLIDWLSNPKVSCRTRHINRKFYFIKDDFEKEGIGRYLAKEEVIWRIKVPSAPKFGGLCESAVKSMKYHLKQVIVFQVLTQEEFSTVIVEIEAVLNSWHMVAASDDPDDLSVITLVISLWKKSCKEFPSLI
ncbi:Retrovirus-related Pol polyprotein from transposon TNT 1-94 [Araneus ventricosus]|uniref:Retrovirus-related Pol polyprotein from transposon TNT 1-94 n=1 Tax=Araneus ventricosus TaxID=182803 RepID=A0A4Y2JJ65_ARAVE|nr:Retrovirus-related Pol polyprotein from transposon TNT 1-94 [Araneus ventricosus]